MSVISIILLVVFIIICILLIGIVLLQNEEGGGMGGLFGGSNSTAFGSRSANVLTKTTYVLVTLFFLSSFGLALLNKSPTINSLDEAAKKAQTVTTENWLDSSEVSSEAPAELTTAGE